MWALREASFTVSDHSERRQWYRNELTGVSSFGVSSLSDLRPGPSIDAIVFTARLQRNATQSSPVCRFVLPAKHQVDFLRIITSDGTVALGPHVGVHLTLPVLVAAMATIGHVKTGFAVVGVLAVATSALVLVKRALEARRDDRRARQIARLQAELVAANEALEAKTAELDRRDSGKPVRVYIDGCFDMMHFGHR